MSVEATLTTYSEIAGSVETEPETEPETESEQDSFQSIWDWFFGH